MPPHETLRYLSGDAVASLDVTASETADAIEDLIRGKSAGGVRSAPKSALALDDGRLFQAMLAHAETPAYAAAKIIGLARDNAARGLAHLAAVIVLLDGETGVPLAIMDGARITAVRTAALTLVAARRLARADAVVAGFVGCGVQARSHLDALAQAFPLREVRAFSRTAASAEAFCDVARGLDLDAAAVSDPRAAVERCDLVITTVPDSAGLEPFVDADWLSPGAFASSVDLGRSWLTAPLARIDRLVVDDRGQEAHAAVRLVDEALVSADLGELLSGAAPGRAREDERNVFVFRGVALADLAAAALIYQRASAHEVGVVLER